MSSTNKTATPKTNEPNPKTNEYIDLNCLIILCFLYYFFKIRVFNGNSVGSLETQVQARLFLLPSGATSMPRQFRRFCPTQSGYVNIHSHTNLYHLYKNNPDQNIIHVLVKKLPGQSYKLFRFFFICIRTCNSDIYIFYLYIAVPAI